MHVGHVRVLVPHPLVPVQMRMAPAGRIARDMGMPVMLVVHVHMGMLDRVVLMLVVIPAIFAVVEGYRLDNSAL